MQRAQHRAVSQLGAQLGHALVEALRGNLAQAGAAELGGHGLHLAGNGGVVCRGHGVVGAHVGQAQRVSLVGEVEIELFGHRVRRVGEVDVGDAPERLGQLVHEAAGLAEIDVLGALGRLRHGGRRHRGARPQRLHDAADRELEGRRGRKPRAAGDVARHDQVEALDLAPGRRELGRHAAHQARRADLLVLARGKIGQVELERLVARARYARRHGAVQRGDALDGDVERACHHMASLVVGVVARDLAARGRVDVRQRAALPELIGEAIDELGYDGTHGTAPFICRRAVRTGGSARLPFVPIDGID